jgi:hypothetical protein
VVPTESVPRELLPEIAMKVKRAIFAGSVKPAPWILKMPIPDTSEAVLGIADITLSFYNVRYTQRDLENLLKIPRSIREALKYVSSVPSVEVFRIA